MLIQEQAASSVIHEQPSHRSAVRGNKCSGVTDCCRGTLEAKDEDTERMRVIVFEEQRAGYFFTESDCLKS